MPYASDTSVSVDRSRAELEKLLRRYGATAFAYFADQDRQMIAFTIGGRNIRMDLMILPRSDKRFTHTPSTGRRRSAVAADEFYDKDLRRRWRSLVLVVKAKLVAIDDGISTIEREFLADMVLDTGQTVEEAVRPYLESDAPLHLQLER